MYRLSSIIVFLLGILPILAQSPHGEELAINCASCHDASGWSIDHTTIKFDHSSTEYTLEGAHAQTIVSNVMKHWFLMKLQQIVFLVILMFIICP